MVCTSLLLLWELWRQNSPYILHYICTSFPHRTAFCLKKKKKKFTKKNSISKSATVYRKKTVVISNKCKTLHTFAYLIYQKLSGSCLGSLHLQCIFTDYSNTSRPINTETFVRNVPTLNINWIEVSPIYSLQQGCPKLFPWGGLNWNLMVDHLTPIVT